MDLVFVYEDKIAQDTQGNYYVGSAFSQAVFDRYLRHFDRITLLMRKADIAPNDTEALARWNKIDCANIDVVILPELWDGFKSYLSIKKHREFRRIVEENITPDRAVIIRVPSTAGKIAAKKCTKMGKPYLAEAVGCPWDSLSNHSLKGKIMAPFAWLKMRYCMKNASYGVYVTSKFLQGRYPTDGVSAAISDVEIQPMDDVILENRLEKIKNHSGKIKIATAAAVNVAFKGQRFVIEALLKLKEQGNTGFEYHMAGGGDNTALKNLAEELGISDQVVFEGSLSHDKMFAWLDDMDLYVQPSLQEGLPRALVEAMSRGLPALGARTGGIPELLGDKYIFPRKGVDGIAKLLNETDSDEMILMAKNNFECAKGFQKELLEKKRFDFYSAYAAAAEGEKA